jgi:hypothetical protein
MAQYKRIPNLEAKFWPSSKSWTLLYSQWRMPLACRPGKLSFSSHSAGASFPSSIQPGIKFSFSALYLSTMRAGWKRPSAGIASGNCNLQAFSTAVPSSCMWICVRCPHQNGSWGIPKAYPQDTLPILSDEPRPMGMLPNGPS